VFFGTGVHAQKSLGFDYARSERDKNGLEEEGWQEVNHVGSHKSPWVGARPMTPPVEKHFQERSAEPQIPPLRSLGFLWKLVALTDLMRLSLRERRTRNLVQCRAAGNPGRDDKGEGNGSIESGCWTETVFITFGGPQAHDSAVTAGRFETFRGQKGAKNLTNAYIQLLLRIC